MPEAFIETLKRDYASITVLSDVAAVLALLPNGIEEYARSIRTQA